MLIAGLTGGLASGKSFVASAFAELGCHVVEADALGHEVIMPGGLAHDAVLAAFGTVSRKALAAIVFKDNRELERLTAIIHPAVRELSGLRFSESNKPIGLYVAAILVETGTYRDFAKLIVTSCTREQQIARALGRPGATLPDVLARLKRQLPTENKTAVADFVIDTSGTPAEALRQTKMVYEDLRRLASS